MKFVIEISASAKRVWEILWRDETLRDWAGLVDPGTYMVGRLEEGSTVQFNSANGYGVTSLVAKLVPNEYILFKHSADTQENGDRDRDDQWTGGREIYKLTEKSDITTLELMLDVPIELEQLMNTSYPKALERVKELSEN